MMAAVDVASRAGGTLALVHVIELPGYLVGGYLAEAAFAEHARGKADQTLGRWAADAENAMHAPVAVKALVWGSLGGDRQRGARGEARHPRRRHAWPHGRFPRIHRVGGRTPRRQAPCSVLVVRGSV